MAENKWVTGVQTTISGVIIAGDRAHLVYNIWSSSTPSMVPSENQHDWLENPPFEGVISYWRLEFSMSHRSFCLFWWRKCKEFSDHPNFKNGRLNCWQSPVGGPALKWTTKRSRVTAKVWVKHWGVLDLPGGLDSETQFGIADLGGGFHSQSARFVFVACLLVVVVVIPLVNHDMKGKTGKHRNRIRTLAPKNCVVGWSFSRHPNAGCHAGDPIGFNLAYQMGSADGFLPWKNRSFTMGAMKKPGLVGIYRGLYYPVL